MDWYWYFLLGFSSAVLVGLPVFIKLIGNARKLSGWKETYERELGGWKELRTIKDVNDFYDEKNLDSYLGKEFLLERKAFLLSRVKELEQKKEVAKDMIPLLIQSILPEMIALFFLGLNKDIQCITFVVAFVFWPYI